MKPCSASYLACDGFIEKSSPVKMIGSMNGTKAMSMMAVSRCCQVMNVPQNGHLAACCMRVAVWWFGR